MERDAACIRYLLHSTNSWEPQETIAKSFTNRRHRVKVELTSKLEDHGACSRRVDSHYWKSESLGKKGNSELMKDVVCKVC